MRYLLVLLISIVLLSCDKKATGPAIIGEYQVRFDLTTDLPEFDLAYTNTNGQWDTITVEYPGQEFYYQSLPADTEFRFRAAAPQEGFVAVYLFKNSELQDKEVILGESGETNLDLTLRLRTD